MKLSKVFSKNAKRISITVINSKLEIKFYLFLMNRNYFLFDICTFPGSKTLTIVYYNYDHSMQ